MKPKYLLFLFIPGFIMILLFPIRSFATGDTISVFPFTETWESGSFETNHWTFPYSQGNWTILQNEGFPQPCAAFSGDPQESNYINALESTYYDARDLTCDDFFLDFDIKLISYVYSETEKLKVILEVDTAEYVLGTYVNQSSFEWEHKHLSLIFSHTNVFRIKFVAYGSYSSNIQNWLIDNISITRKCRKPINFGGSSNNSNPCINYLGWNYPGCALYPGNIADFIFDDGGYEMSWGVNAGYVLWLGNVFPIASTLTGYLQSFDLYFISNAGCPPPELSIDVFDDTHTLIGSTDPFIAGPTEEWITVQAPNIPFTGAFYVMVLWSNEINCSVWFSEDTDGPYATDNLSWMYDGTQWTHLPGDPGVFLLRAKAYIYNNLKDVELSPISKSDTSVVLGYNLYRQEAYSSNDSVKINNDLILDTTYIDTTNGENLYFYSVTAVYNNQCESEVSQVGPFGCYFSVEEKTVQKSINIIPNPASDFIEISSIYSITGIGITDSWGVLKYRNDAIKETEYRLNVSGFPPGLYFISVITEKGTTTQKVVVMH